MKTLSSIIILVIYFHITTSSQLHPHGESKQMLSMIDDEGEKQFITETENIEEIFLHPEVKDRKIVVLSIIGAYRKGKSFFLDYCLRYLYAQYQSINNLDETKPIGGDWIGDGNAPLQGFSWKHGRTADTKGIKIWSDVFLHDTPTEKVAIVVMDTQGLFEPRSTHEENGRIFGLSTLISSIQILNIKDVLQEDQLEYLEMATNLAKIIVKKQKTTDWKPFQRLLFLFRDWADETIGYGYEGGLKYLDDEVLAVFDDLKSTKGSVIRQNIRGSFDEISCFLLDNPGQNIKKGHGEWSTLEEGFVTNMKILIESLLAPKNLVKKSALGKDLTATEFQGLIKIYFNAFANAKLPATENILQMAIDNQMQTIVNDQLKVFNKLQANLNVDFDRENFVDWVNEVHDKNEKTAVDGFLNTEKIDDEESTKKFVGILKKEIGIVFENWNQSNMKIYEELQDQKRLREIENCFDQQLRNYQELMNKDIDFNQDNFEKYYEDLHKSKMEYAFKELEKMNFKDETSKLNVTKSLEHEIITYFASLKTSKISEFNQHLKVVTLLAETQFEAYKSNLYLNVEYENHDDFETYIYEKYSNAKNATLNGFENSHQLTFTPRKTQFKDELITKLDDEYLIWKEATMKVYEDLQDKKNQREIEKSIDFQDKIYKKNMSTNIDFNQDDFEKYYEDLHKKTVTNAILELEKMRFNDEARKQNYTKSLETKLNEVYNTMNASKIAEFNQHLKIVALLVDSQFDAYKIDLNRNIEYENHTNFESYIDTKHSTAKNSAIDRFLNSHQLSFVPRKAQFKAKLIAKIDSEYLMWKNATLKIYGKFQDKKHQTEIEKCINLQVINYQKMMSNNIDFNQDDFEKYYDDLHKFTMNKSVHELEKIKFKDEATKINSTKALENRLIEHYAAFSGSKIAEFNQHLRAVSTIADTQFEAYKNNLKLNLNYENHTNFEEYINKKHLSSKNGSLNGYDNLKWMTFTPRKAQFKQQLVAKIDNEYLTWKNATMKIYEKFLSQKRQIAIEKCLNLQPKKYRHIMSTNLDFNQDDFEKYYAELDKSSMANAVKELHKLTFKDEASKQNLTKSLEIELIEIYTNLRPSKIADYNQYLKVISLLTDTQLAAYKSNLNQNLNYEKYHDFLEYIENKHMTTKNATLNNFENSKLSFAPRKSQLKQKLISNIDSDYPGWIASTLKTFNAKVNEKFQQFVNSQLNKYKSSFNEYVNLKQFDYLNIIKMRHENKKVINLLEFRMETIFLNNAASQLTYKSQLSTNIDNAYSNWYSGKKTEHTNYIRGLLQTTLNNKLQRYKSLIEKFEDDFKDSNYESKMKQKYEDERTAVIAEFNSESRNIVDQSLVMSFANSLSNDINSFKSDYLREKMVTYNDLRRNGIWVPWNGNKSGVPKYAVVGGDGENGSQMYFARAEITHKGSDRGQRIGRYELGTGVALFQYEDHHFRKNYFDVFTHTNYKWVHKLGSNTGIWGFKEKYTDGTEINFFMCRSTREWHRYTFPGAQYNGICYVPQPNKMAVIEQKYDFLVRA